MAWGANKEMKAKMMKMKLIARRPRTFPEWVNAKLS
jgi:hypothetical protein